MGLSVMEKNNVDIGIMYVYMYMYILGEFCYFKQVFKSGQEMSLSNKMFEGRGLEKDIKLRFVSV